LIVRLRGKPPARDLAEAAARPSSYPRDGLSCWLEPPQADPPGAVSFKHELLIGPTAKTQGRACYQCRGDDLRSPLAPHQQHLAGLLPLDQRHDVSAPYLERVAFSGFVLRPIVDAGDPPAPFLKDLPGKKSGAQVGLFRLERLARCAASCTIPIDYLNWPPTSDGSHALGGQRCIHSPCKPRSCVIC
jgi:hypothetical protein